MISMRKVLAVFRKVTTCFELPQSLFLQKKLEEDNTYFLALN